MQLEQGARTRQTLLETSHCVVEVGPAAIQHTPKMSQLRETTIEVESAENLGERKTTTEQPTRRVRHCRRIVAETTLPQIERV